MRMPPDYCLLGRKKSGVVTDGLIFWMDGRDGIDHDESGFYFIDRASGDKIPIIQNGSVIDEGTGIAVDGGRTVILINSKSLSQKFYVDKIGVERGNFSVEFNAKITKNLDIPYSFSVANQNNNHYGNQLGFQMVESVYGYGLKIGSKFNVQTKINLIGTVYESTKNIISVVQDANEANVYVNGTNIGVVSGEFATSYLYPLYYFSDRNDGDVLDIGSIRVYNKILSAEEILQNYAYEKSLGRVT